MTKLIDMKSSRSRDLVAGTVLVAVGIGVAAYAAANYRLGEVTSMGPGIFPLALGVVLVGLGLLIAVVPMLRTAEVVIPEFNGRALLSVLAAAVTFALTAMPFGMFPAVVLMTLVSTLADPQFRLLPAIGLAVVLAVGATLLFSVGLGVSIPPFRWPF